MTTRVADVHDGLSAADSSDPVDPADLERVQAVLSHMAFLRPADETGAAESGSDTAPDPADEPMPPWVWDRLSAAIAAEADGPATTRRPGWMRWGGGLVAASVAVLAVGIAVTTFSGGEDQDLVARSAPEAAIDQTPQALSFAGMVPPALKLIDSQTDYTPNELGEQVEEILTEMGMEPEAAMDAMEQAPEVMPMPAEMVPALSAAVADPTSVLTSPRSLRDCITKLTNLATSTALLIDWATFDGEDAGVVVTPEYPETGTSRPDMSELDVWVIDHDCDVKAGVHIRMK